MKYVIIEIDEILFKVDYQAYNSPVFTVENSDYMIEISVNNGNLTVSNAMDGYGFNKRDYFKEKSITVYIINHA